MKALNTMKFISNAIENLTGYKAAIEAAETYEDAKNVARKMMGYIDCLETVTNTMICEENNDFTPDLCDVLEGWMHKMYQALICKAEETHQPHDTIFTLCQTRDEYKYFT